MPSFLRFSFSFSFLALALLGLAAGAHAQQAPRSERLRQATAAVQQRLQEADIDGDGYIQRDEAAAKLPRVAQHFDAIDGDGDGRLSNDELRQAFAQMRERRGGGAEASP